jgi:hypothetical protein
MKQQFFFAWYAPKLNWFYNFSFDIQYQISSKSVECFWRRTENENVIWMELDHVQRWASVLAVLMLRALLPEGWLIC